jgi:DNA-binding MarR family transcriptional regulator
MENAQTITEFSSLRLEDQLCFPLYACAKEVVRQYRKPLEKLNLTYTQYLVMMVLWEFGGMTEGEIGRKVHLDSGTLSPLLKRLDKQGYINRIRPDDNERKLFLTLTEAGEALKEQALEVPCAMEQIIDLSQEELRQLKQLLEKALRRMERNSVQ